MSILGFIAIYGGYVFKVNRLAREKTLLYSIQSQASKYKGDLAAQKAVVRQEINKKKGTMKIEELQEMLNESKKAIEESQVSKEKANEIQKNLEADLKARFSLKMNRQTMKTKRNDGNMIVSGSDFLNRISERSKEV